MESTELPFSKLIGIQRETSGALSLALAETTQNHLGTMHAGAQFALGESASADCLQALFPELIDSVVPVLRASKVRYRHAATTDVLAVASVADDARETFLDRLKRKGRGSIAVEVELRDGGGQVTCQGIYEWYVQRLEP